MRENLSEFARQSVWRPLTGQNQLSIAPIRPKFADRVDRTFQSCTAILSEICSKDNKSIEGCITRYWLAKSGSKWSPCTKFFWNIILLTMFQCVALGVNNHSGGRWNHEIQGNFPYIRTKGSRKFLSIDCVCGLVTADSDLLELSPFSCIRNDFAQAKQPIEWYPGPNIFQISASLYFWLWTR